MPRGDAIPIRNDSESRSQNRDGTVDALNDCLVFETHANIKRKDLESHHINSTWLPARTVYLHILAYELGQAQRPKIMTDPMPTACFGDSTNFIYFGSRVYEPLSTRY